jgi:hypothetical protein
MNQQRTLFAHTARTTPIQGMDSRQSQFSVEDLIPCATDFFETHSSLNGFFAIRN